MEQHKTLRETFKRYINDQLSEREAKDFLAHIQSGKDRDFVEELLQEAFTDPIAQDLLKDSKLWAVLDGSWANLESRIALEQPEREFNWRPIMGVAALLICILTIGIGFYRNSHPPEGDTFSTHEVISPGQQTATLLLADGRQIRLSEAENGQLAEDGSVRISKSADGQLVYEILEGQDASSGYNTLSTDKGETYKVWLPDGTQVWLNAESSMRYVTNFTAHETRRVELHGEAYFDVTEDAQRPFIVHTDKLEITVIGTRFNINSYTDEPTLRTTVFEGSVELNSKGRIATLRPGQQANLSASGIIQVREVDTDPVISWVNNEFMFDGDDIDAVMRKIARWYNVEIVYQGVKTTEKFGGGLSRFEQVDQALQLLEKTGVVKFRIEGNIIYVLPKGN